MKYIVDTQMLVRATRSAEEAERYATFLSAFSSSVYLCSVVAQELLAGSRDAEARRLEAFITRFEKLRRTAAPTYASWRRAGEILCRLRRAGFTITPSLTNDVLIACTAMQIVLKSSTTTRGIIARSRRGSRSGTGPITRP